jgi:hypothetical protein
MSSRSYMGMGVWEMRVMKITVDVSDELYRRAKAEGYAAAGSGT